MNEKIHGKLMLYIYSIWMVALTILYFVLINTGQTTLLPFAWAAIGVSGIAAIIIGVLRYKPAARAAWLFLAAANLFFISGDTYYKVMHYLLNQENPFPSISDLMYLTTYPLFAVGTFLFIKRRSFAKTDRGAILDAATFTAGLTLLVWIYLVVPNASADMPLLAKITSIAYPLGDILVWAMLVRLLMLDMKTRSMQLLAVGAVGLIVADIIYGLGQFYGFWQEGGPVDLGWILFYSCWGAAALHPSMKSLDNKVAKLAHIRVRRLVLLAATALLAPLVLFVETLRGNADQVATVVAAFAAILFVLVVLRMFTLLSEISRRDAEIALERQKQEIIGLVSHQLRTPLTIIQLYSEEMQKTVNDEQTMLGKAVIAIHSAGQRLAELVKTLLYSTSVSLDELELSVSPQNLNVLVEAAIAENKNVLTEKQVTYTIQTDPSLSEVPTDPQVTILALSYIINNAARYSKYENAEMKIQLRSDADNAYISIEDNGAGIPDEDQPKIFTKLFRGSNAVTHFPDGVGLGLYLTKSVLSLLGGDVKFSSKVDQGTTFTVTLPLKNELFTAPEVKS